MIGTFNESSTVCPSSCPAFEYCRDGPKKAATGTARIWSFAWVFDRVNPRPMRSNNSASMPTSVSRTVSGLSSLLPNVAWPPIVPDVSENVSYCAKKGGLFPAVPTAARSFSSFTFGMNHQASCDKRHAPAARPKVLQRFARPKRELPSRRTRPSKM